MTQADRMTNGAGALFHPVSHYNGPDDILRDPKLSAPEKRIILSSWASDMYAVESNPALRAVPGISHEMRLQDILAALCRLDEDDDPPPRGAAAMRVVPFVRLNAVGGGSAASAPRREPRRPASNVPAPSCARWSREANVRRYRRLLMTELTDGERRFVERRLAEELGAAGRAANGAAR